MYEMQKPQKLIQTKIKQLIQVVSCAEESKLPECIHTHTSFQHPCSQPLPKSVLEGVPLCTNILYSGQF